MAKAPQVKIDIAAVDQFSAMLMKFRRDLKASGDAAALVNSKSRGLSLPDMDFAGAGKQLGAFHAQATRQIGSLSRMVPGMGALGGIASVAGVGEMVTRYAGLGVELKNVAQVAGTTAAGMDSMRGSARMLGLSAGSADQVMTGLNKTLADAYYGKNADAAAAFRQAGIGLQGMAGGAAKAEEKLAPIADFVQRLMKSDPRAAVTFVDKLGLGPDAINLLGIGAERLEALRKEAGQLSGITDDNQASAEKFAGAMGRVGIAADRVGRTVMTSLEPVLTPMLTNLATWTSEHSKEVQDTFKGLATGIGSVALAIPDAVRRLHDYGDEVMGLFDKFKKFGEMVGADKVGKYLKEAFSNPDAGLPADGVFDQKVFDKLSPGDQIMYQMNHGSRAGFNRQVAPDRYSGAGGGSVDSTLTPQMRGLLDTIAGPESGGRYNVSNGGATFSDFSRHPGNLGGKSSAAGRYQFVQGTWEEAQKALNLPDFSPGSQDKAAAWLAARDYKTRTGRDLNTDLNSSDPAVRRRIATALAPTWSSLPGGVEQTTTADRFDESLRKNRAIYEQKQAQPPEEPDLTRGGRVAAPKPEEPDLTRGGRVPQALTPAPVAQGTNSAVHIHLTGDNLPQGMTPQIRTEGDGAELASVRLRYAMPTGG